MGHGFDDQGRNYDAAGTLRDWWTKQDADQYKKRAQGDRRSIQRVRAAARD